MSEGLLLPRLLRRTEVPPPCPTFAGAFTRLSGIGPLQDQGFIFTPGKPWRCKLPYACHRLYACRSVLTAKPYVCQIIYLLSRTSARMVRMQKLRLSFVALQAFLLKFQERRKPLTAFFQVKGLLAFCHITQ